MGIFKDYFKIGKTAPPEEFLKTYKSKAKNTDYNNNASDMIAGALKAFGEGQPTNVQAILSHVQELESYNYSNMATRVLSQLPEKFGGKDKDLEMALAELPEKDRKDFLSKALYTAVNYRIGDDKFCELLLKAGEDANYAVGGHAGIMLVVATCNQQSMNVIKLLHEHGASFDDALMTMHCQNRRNDDIERLKFFQQKLTGAAEQKPAGLASPDLQSDDVRVLLAEILEQMKEITKRLPPLPEDQQDAAQPKIKKPDVGKGYPKL